MVTNLSIEKRNAVLIKMAELVNQEQEAIIKSNQQDLQTFAGGDLAMLDRLKVDKAKIQEMINSLIQLASQDDPVGKELFHFTHENGLEIYNKTAAFGTILIIYESRPDVTVEAAGIAFKSGNKILLKGGKESINSNLKIVELWHQALAYNEVTAEWVEYLNINREETQVLLKNPPQKIDLIIPRGGEKLIAFVKEHATCPVVVSGRGNNFAFVDKDADLDKAVEIILNAKTAKISACNALDKVLVDENLPDYQLFVELLVSKLKESGVKIYVEKQLDFLSDVVIIKNEQIWYEEFLDYKIVIGTVNSLDKAIAKINQFCGGHSATIISGNEDSAKQFMESVDAAAVYQNASTRFTDGFQFGLGGELAISTDKLHQRGPMGLEHLVTNKWYVFGNGQTR